VATYCRFCEAAASANRTKAIISYLGEGTLYADFVEKNIEELVKIAT